MESVTSVPFSDSVQDFIALVIEHQNVDLPETIRKQEPESCGPGFRKSVRTTFRKLVSRLPADRNAQKKRFKERKPMADDTTSKQAQTLPDQSSFGLCNGPKSIGTVLLEELIETSESTEKKDKLVQAFSKHFIKADPDHSFFRLQENDILNKNQFVKALRKPKSKTAQQFTALFGSTLQKCLDARGEPECLFGQVIDKLNGLVEGKVVEDKAIQDNIQKTHGAIAAFYSHSPPAENRRLLEAAFPEHIARVWDKIPLSTVHQWIHTHPDARRDGLCLSGGGIRSATFGLGVLQGLAKTGTLKKFHYLSTVSGGGYIGSWLTAWSKRAGFDAVCDSLIKKTKDPLNPEPEQIQHLRQYSNYLTPKLGLTSADTWTLIATYVRNLFLNWIVFVPALALILALPRIGILALRQHVTEPWAFAILIVGMLLGSAAIAWAARHRPGIRKSMGEGSHQPTVGQTKFLACFLAPLVLCAACISVLWGWLQNPVNTPSFKSRILEPCCAAHDPPVLAFVIFGLVLHLLAYLFYFSCLRGKRRIAEFGRCAITGTLGGLLLWKGASWTHHDFVWAPDLEWYVCIALPYFLFSFLTAATVFIGISSRVTEDMDREWWARMGGWIMIAGLAWTVFSTLVLFGPEALLKIPKLVTALGGISGIITLWLSHSGKTAANKKEAKQLGPEAKPANMALALAAPIFMLCFVASLSLGTTWLISKLDNHPEFHGQAKIGEDAITDFPALVTRLKRHGDAESAFVWTNLSQTLRDQVTQYTGGPEQTKTLRTALASELDNKLVRGEFEDDVIKGAGDLLGEDIRTNTAIALAEDLEGQKAFQRNWMILQDAFETELDQGRFSHRMITHNSSTVAVVIALGSLLLAAFCFSHLVNINKFSLHSVYRDRLIRAYLGASNADRRPNAFSGFDPADNLHMAELPKRPFHLVNMALNLVAGDNLAWQQRKAETFTASPLHAGNFRLGYRRVCEYCLQPTQSASENKNASPDKSDGLTLGTAVAISGAAASPNMGYHSSPVLAALMTLFNVRLGAWLGNPGKAGETTYKDPAPRSAFKHLALEAFGLTDEHSPYVYLSDGGHFENLGLYELVLRRCRRIMVSDAGSDPACALEDLGNAIRKIRIDLGIRIDIDDTFKISARTSDSPSKYCALATIHYGDVDDGADPGKLLYIKPAIAGNEPKDVFNYKEQSLLFPHEPTSDQWFSESQFESYRVLGKHIVTEISGGLGESEKTADAPGKEKTEPTRKTDQPEEDLLEQLFTAAANYLKKVPDVADVSASRAEVILVGKAKIGI